MTAAEAGKSVVMLEKMDIYGGNTNAGEGTLNAPDPERQEPMGIEDSPDFYYTQTFEGGDSAGDPALVRILADNALDAVHWMEDHGLIYEKEVFTAIGGLWQRGHAVEVERKGEQGGSYYVSCLMDAAQATGNFTLYTDAKIEELIVEGGAVVGVRGTRPSSGEAVEVRGKSVVLATGGYSHNEKMLGQYAPWILKNQDKFLFSYEVTDHDGNPADTGDGQQMGMNVGGHLDVGPHAVMAHILQFGQEFFLQVNEHGERFTNEDLSMTNIAKVMQNQPGSKVFQIIDSHWPEQYPMLEMVMENIRSYGDGEGFSAQADSLEELASQLELSADATQNLTAAVARYNELCEKGVDEDFGKAAEKMFPVVDPPFYAITYDMLKHTSVEDVSCMRLLVTMGGLVTDDNARVLNDDMEPIPGLFAVGNVQGGRFVEDYPFTLSGASHAAALTYGYLTGKYLAEQA